MEIYEETIKTYNIDTTKIYLTGLSQGGRGTWKIAARYPKMFAAIAPMCGWADEDTAKAIKHIPIWAFHGEIDQVVKVESTYNMEKWLKAAGAKDLKVTIYPGVDHGCWDMAYQNEALPEFFLKHSTK